MLLKPLIKQLLQAVIPQQLWLRMISARSRRINQALLRNWGCPELNQKLIAKYGAKAMGGLFPGLLLINDIHTAQIGPFLLGTYEEEIAPWFLRLKGRKYSQILDVGSSFGYYAVGLATWFPDTPVIAFDTDSWARQSTRKMAAANGVSNVSALGYCDTAWLAQNMQENALLVCDCEGFEFELLDPRRVPALRTATIIVESHDSPPWEKHTALIQKFKPTHDVLEETFRGNDRPHKMDLAWLSPLELSLAIGEGRTVGQKWLMFEPLH